MIDTHSHIYLEEFDNDRAAVIDRAKAVGVEHIVLPNVDNTTLARMLHLEASDPTFFHAAIGLHPTSVNADYEKELAWVMRELDSHPYCAIGEVGLDLYWDKTFVKEQVTVFERQLQWAVDYDLPVIIHVRDAFELAIASVEKYNNASLKGIFHSFGGTVEEAQRIMGLGGFKMGINGVVTFKNSTLGSVLPHVPLEYLVLETDAPYLTPVPYRGKRNESAYLEYIKNKLAEVYNLSPEEIAKKTLQNSVETLKILTLPAQSR
jgi:TatD DNase family protein